LIIAAYQIKSYELSAPEWIKMSTFDVDATVPLSASKDEFHEMERRLLAERFGLSTHREQRMMSCLRLVVTKNGPRLKMHEVGQPPELAQSAAPTVAPLDAQGYPILLPGTHTTMTVASGRARRRAVDESMGQFAAFLSAQFNRPTEDGTGLDARYDFTLSWILNGVGLSQADPLDTGPILATALQEQLGLKLDSANCAVNMLVVDHAQKQPIAN
jgi:uncharacterized protein (TIGR03435 family)